MHPPAPSSPTGKCQVLCSPATGHVELIPCSPKAPQTPDDIARQILAPLLDPTKVVTRKGDRPTNHRLYKVLYWLETARERGGDVGKVFISTAQAVDGYRGTPAAKADKVAILANRRKLEDFGCLTPDGKVKLRKGGSCPSVYEIGLLRCNGGRSASPHILDMELGSC